MKIMKRIASLALALLLVMALGVSAFAADDGSITITGTSAGEKYTVYKLFDATIAADEEGATTATAYTYTTTGEGDALLAALQGEGSPFTLTETATAGLYSVAVPDGMTGETIAAWCKTNESLLGTGTEATVAEGATSVTVSVPYGYYYITSTVGTVVAVQSANPAVSIEDKNEDPTIDKEAEKSDAGVGEDVPYTITVHAKKGASNYVVHDTMTAGLSFNNDVVVTVGGVAVDAANYTVTTDVEDSCTFEVAFNNDYLATLTADGNVDIVITYSAEITADAIDGYTVDNKAILSYGNGSKTTETEPEGPGETTFGAFNVSKYDGQSNAALTGAVFQLYAAAKGEDGTYTVAEDATPIELVKVTAEDGTVSYRPVTDADLAEGSAAEIVTTIEAGTDVNVLGLKAGSYALRETAAPDGYNRMTTDFGFDVAAKANTDVDVPNNAGTTLPSTGGIGTTIFYVVGGILVVAAVVLLITKKRMSAKG